MVRSRLLLSLLVISLISLVQLAATLSLSSAFKSLGTASSNVLEEEEVDDDLLAEDLVELAVETVVPTWDDEQQPPAPVHLEREGRPPPA